MNPAAPAAVTTKSALPVNRRPSALAGFLRLAATLILLFVLCAAGYYLYFNVINRPAAEVYVAQRGTAVAAVYGTVTINSTFALTVFSANAGYMHLAPGFGSKTTSLGIVVQKDELLCTVVDEVGQRTLNSARTDYEACVAKQKVGPNTAGMLQSAKDQVASYSKLPPNAVPQVTREQAANEVIRIQSIIDAEALDLQHNVDVTSSALKAAEDALKRTEIRAPFDGIITEQDYNDNAFVQGNVSLFVVSAKDTYVSGQVNEEDVGQLRMGMKAEVRLYAYVSQNFDATVSAILPSPDANSSRYTVTLTLDKPPDNLMYGMTGEMNIILGRKENALIVPARALNVDQVLIVEDGTVEQRTVKTGFKSLEYAEISEGLSPGQMVIVSDQDAFQPGERVRPVKTNLTGTKK